MAIVQQPQKPPRKRLSGARFRQAGETQRLALDDGDKARTTFPFGGASLMLAARRAACQHDCTKKMAVAHPHEVRREVLARIGGAIQAESTP